jgi:hypothetical protein
MERDQGSDLHGHESEGVNMKCGVHLKTSREDLGHITVHAGAWASSGFDLHAGRGAARRAVAQEGLTFASLSAYPKNWLSVVACTIRATWGSEEDS